MRITRGVRITVDDAYMAWYQRAVEDDQQTLRCYAMWRAADFVLDSKARYWLDPHDVLWSRRRVYTGSIDDESLKAILVELEQLRMQETPVK